MNLKELYEKNGSDYEKVLHRFCGDEHMLLNFVVSFTGDPVFQQLETAMEAKNFPNIESHAHALKGVAANLGFDRLYAACSDMVSHVRQGQYDAAMQEYPKLRQAYQSLVADIKSLN